MVVGGGSIVDGGQWMVDLIDCPTHYQMVLNPEQPPSTIH
jgi:hypothetical protein